MDLAEHVGDVCEDSASRCRGSGGEDVDGEESVDHPSLAAVSDWNVRGGQPSSTGVALVPKRIVLSGDDNGGRQPTEVGGVQRADLGVGEPGRARDPLLDPSCDVVGRQAPARGLRPCAGTGECQIGVGIHQDLGGRQRSALIDPTKTGFRPKSVSRLARGSRVLQGQRPLGQSADDGGRGAAEVAEWERIGQLLAEVGGVYEPALGAAAHEEQRAPSGARRSRQGRAAASDTQTA